MTIHKAYKFRLYPNTEQKVMFAKTFGCVRLIFNHFLNLWQEEYKDTKKGLSYNQCSALLPKLKSDENYWYLKEVDSIALQNSLIDLDDAYKRFFNKQNKAPLFKSKLDSKQTYRTKNTNNNLYIKCNYIKLPKIGLVKIKNSFNFDKKIINATITKTSSNKYYVSVLVDEDIKPLPLTESNIGIDLGLNDYVVMSDGTKIENIKIDKELIKKLNREKRKLSRMALKAKERGVDLREAKNYQKQRIAVTRIYERIKNIINDFTNKLSTNIIKNHDIICLESLNVEKMLKNKYLAKSISDSQLSNFVRKLEYKARWYGKDVVKVNTYFPSSKLCSSCGHHNGKKALHIRTWECLKCNATHDRDINASINVLTEGLRIFNST